MEKVGTYSFLAEPFRCDFDGKIFLGNLGNDMLNAADFHAAERGFGVKKLMEHHRAWVISRLVIEMESMPKMYDSFRIETWVESVKRYFSNRNFSVVGTGPDGSEHVYGYGRFIWAMIDTDTRQPVDIFSLENVPVEVWRESDKACPIQRCSRVSVPPEAKLVKTFDAHYSDIDINGHFNSIKYIERVLDLWPIEWHQEHSLKRIEVAFVTEAHPGDTLSIYHHQLSDLEHAMRITRPDGAECCRCCLSFT